MNTSRHVYDNFVRLLFLHENREASILVGELPEEPEQFRFFKAAHLTNLKDSVGLILAKVFTVRVTIPIDLSTWSFTVVPECHVLCVHFESFIGFLYIIVLV